MKVSLRPRSCLSNEGDKTVSVFTSKLTVSDICQTHNCNELGVQYSTNEEQEQCIKATRAGRCKQCLNPTKTVIDQFSGAHIIPINECVCGSKCEVQN